MAEYKLYRGEVKTLKEITVTEPLVVQRASEIPGKIPRFIVLHKVERGAYQGYKTVWFWNPDKEYQYTYLELEDTVTLNILSGRKGEEVRAKFNIFYANDFTTRVTRHPKSVGADPEIFAENDSGVVPAWTFLGSKNKPTAGSAHCGSAQHAYWDGFQAEFDTPGYGCLAYHMDSIHTGLKLIYDNLPKDARLSIKTVVPIDPEVLASAEEKYVEFGCMPSKNAYGLKGRGDSGREVPYRFAGGHIHLGIDAYSRKKLDMAEGVKGMDAIVGVLATSLFASFDNPVRREYYGLPGEYRLPPHGVEYRSLSNAWLMHPAIAHVVFEIARLGFDYGVAKLNIVPQDRAVEVMRHTDVDGARALITEYRDFYTGLLRVLPPFKTTAAQVIKLCLDGAESLVEEPANLAKNWRLDPAGRRWIDHSDDLYCNWRQACVIHASGGKI